MIGKVWGTKSKIIKCEKKKKIYQDCRTQNSRECLKNRSQKKNEKKTKKKFSQ